MNNVDIATTERQEAIATGIQDNINREAERAAGIRLTPLGNRSYGGLRSIADFRTVRPQYVDWLPLRKGFALASGPNDVGKSSVIERLAARVLLGTAEGAWHGEPHGVCFVLSEDSPSDIKSTMLAHGVSERIMRSSLFAYVENDDSDDMASSDYETLRLPEDIEFLRSQCEARDIRLVVFDALADCMSGLKLSDRGDVSRAIKPLNKWGAESDVLLIGVHHNNKGMEGTAKQAVSGSTAFTDKPRVVVSFEKKEDDTRVMQLVKVKGRSDNPAYEFRFETRQISTDDGQAKDVGIVTAITPTDLTVDAIRSEKASQQSPDGGGQAERGEVIDWLTEYLRDGPASFRDIAVAAADEGYTKTQLDHARRRAKDPYVVTVPDPSHTGRGRSYLWQLSENEQQ